MTSFRHGIVNVNMRPTPGPEKSALLAILRGLCPRCRRGPIFQSAILRGWPRMHERCPVCGLQYEREHGYFMGAMYISYALALPLLGLLIALFWAGTNWSWTARLIAAFVLFLPFVPGLTLMSRVLWIYLDRAIDRE
jgi:uncharacterized protein (DUF983 family)